MVFAFGLLIAVTIIALWGIDTVERIRRLRSHAGHFGDWHGFR
jgi:hypothetical protein